MGKYNGKVKADLNSILNMALEANDQDPRNGVRDLFTEDQNILQQVGERINQWRPGAYPDNGNWMLSNQAQNIITDLVIENQHRRTNDQLAFCGYANKPHANSLLQFSATEAGQKDILERDSKLAGMTPGARGAFVLANFRSMQYSKLTMEQARQMSDQDLIQNFQKIYSAAQRIGYIDEFLNDKDFSFTDEQRSNLEKYKEALAPLNYLMERMELIANPYYGYLSPETMKEMPQDVANSLLNIAGKDGMFGRYLNIHQPQLRQEEPKIEEPKIIEQIVKQDGQPVEENNAPEEKDLWSEKMASLQRQLGEHNLDFSMVLRRSEGQHYGVSQDDRYFKEQLERDGSVILVSKEGKEYVVENGTFSITFQPFLTHYLEKNGIQGDNLTFMDTKGAIIRPEDPVNLEKGVIVFKPGESVRLIRSEAGQFHAADASQQLNQLGQQLDDANKGFFIGSSAFRSMRKAFRDLTKDFPTLNDFADQDDLRPAMTKLQKVKETAEAYLRTKQMEPPFEYTEFYAKNDRERRRIDAALEAYRFADRQLSVVNQLMPEDEAFFGRESNAVIEREELNDPAFKLRMEKGQKVVVSQEKELYPGQNKARAFVKSMETIRLNAMDGELMLITGLTRGVNKQNEPFETTADIRRFLLEVALFPVVNAIHDNYADGRYVNGLEDALGRRDESAELLKWAKGFDNLVYNTKVFLTQAVPDEMVEKMLAYAKNPDDMTHFSEIATFTDNLQKTMDAYRMENADIPNIKRIGSPEIERDFNGLGNEPVIDNQKFLG